MNNAVPYSSDSRETTVLVAVRAPEVREALVALVGSLSGFRVVGEASTDRDAVGAARALRPMLAVVDQELSGFGGAWTVQTLHDERLVPAIVALGLRADDGTRSRAQSAGAQAFVQLGAPPMDVLEALRHALKEADRRWVPPGRIPAAYGFA